MIHFRVASSALGERETVYVHLYDDLDSMRRASTDFNGNDNSGALAVTQGWADQNGRMTYPLIRLVRGYVGTEIVSHEMHHAATALYGAHVGDRISRRAHLTHHNEPFAHLYSDLLSRLVDRLYAEGCYS